MFCFVALISPVFIESDFSSLRVVNGISVADYRSGMSFPVDYGYTLSVVVDYNLGTS